LQNTFRPLLKTQAQLKKMKRPIDLIVVSSLKSILANTEF
jgi:hypothetical protein